MQFRFCEACSLLRALGHCPELSTTESEAVDKVGRYHEARHAGDVSEEIRSLTLRPPGPKTGNLL